MSDPSEPLVVCRWCGEKPRRLGLFCSPSCVMERQSALRNEASALEAKLTAARTELVSLGRLLVELSGPDLTVPRPRPRVIPPGVSGLRAPSTERAPQSTPRGPRKFVASLDEEALRILRQAAP